VIYLFFRLNPWLTSKHEDMKRWIDLLCMGKRNNDIGILNSFFNLINFEELFLLITYFNRIGKELDKNNGKYCSQFRR
jgi:hypothetical protein